MLSYLHQNPSNLLLALVCIPVIGRLSDTMMQMMEKFVDTFKPSSVDVLREKADWFSCCVPMRRRPPRSGESKSSIAPAANHESALAAMLMAALIGDVAF